MVNQCFLCKKMDYKHSYLTFHRVPKDETLRKLWAEKIKIKSTFPSSARLCSEHFDVNHITLTPSGKALLRHESLPLPLDCNVDTTVHKTDNEISACKGEMVIDVSKGCEDESVMDYENTLSSQQQASTLSSSSLKRRHLDFTTATTSMASETEEHLIGMMEVGKLEDASDAIGQNSPFRGKLSLINVKKCKLTVEKPAKVIIESQKRKIRTLQQSVRRLKAKVDSLNSLLKFQKEKAMITTENAEAAIVDVQQRSLSVCECESSNTDTECMPEQEASQGVETSGASHHIQSASTTPTSSTKRSFSQMVPPQRAKILKRLPSNKRQPTRFESAVTKLQHIAELTTADTEDQYDQFGKHIVSQLRELPLRSFVILQSKFQNLITVERLTSLNVNNGTPLSQTVLLNYDVDDIGYSNSTSTNEFEEESSNGLDVLSPAMLGICEYP